MSFREGLLCLISRNPTGQARSRFPDGNRKSSLSERHLLNNFQYKNAREECLNLKSLPGNLLLP